MLCLAGDPQAAYMMTEYKLPTEYVTYFGPWLLCWSFLLISSTDFAQKSEKADTQQHTNTYLEWRIIYSKLCKQNTVICLCTVYLSIYLVFYLYRSIILLFYLSFYLSIVLSIALSFYLSIWAGTAMGSSYVPFYGSRTLTWLLTKLLLFPSSLFPLWHTIVPDCALHGSFVLCLCTLILSAPLTVQLDCVDFVFQNCNTINSCTNPYFHPYFHFTICVFA